MGACPFYILGNVEDALECSSGRKKWIKIWMENAPICANLCQKMGAKTEEKIPSESAKEIFSIYLLHLSCPGKQ